MGLQIRVWDWDSHSVDDVIGTFNTSLKELVRTTHTTLPTSLRRYDKICILCILNSFLVVLKYLRWAVSPIITSASIHYFVHRGDLVCAAGVQCWFDYGDHCPE